MTAHQKLHEKIVELEENTLTKNYIIPLLKELGWEKVEFHGGVYEEGKDIICWRKDEWGDVELGVAQVKKYKMSAKATDKTSFMELVNQLQQATEIEVPNPDGNYYTPAIVYCITPFEINSRALKTRFDGYSRVLKERGVKVIDGSKLVSNLIEKLPDLVSELLGTEEGLKQASYCNLNNSILMGALNFDNIVDIESCYCDLEFVIGNINTRLFYGKKYNSKRIKTRLSASDWNRINDSLYFVEKHEQPITVPSASEIEKFFSNNESNQLEFQSQIILNSKQLDEKYRNIKSYENDIAEILIVLESKKIVHEYSFVSKSKDAIQHYFNDVADDGIHGVNYGYHVDELTKLLKDVKLSPAEDTYEVHEQNRKILSVMCEDLICMKEVLTENMRIANEVSSIGLDIEIDGDRLASFLDVNKKSIDSKILDINTSPMSISNLTAFLDYCENLYMATDNLLKLHAFTDSIGIAKGQDFGSVANCPRLTIGLNHILDTGKNFAIFGEAGAGKTTSLQMYAKKFLDSNRTDKIVLYVPLVMALSEYGHDVSKRPDDRIKAFLDVLSKYLKSCGSTVSVDEIISLFKSEKVTILLDGIDEALMSAPWITDVLNDLTEVYTNVQLVVSARLGMNYQDKISFLGASLMELTDVQRSNFIESWFSQVDKSAFTSQVISHLAKNKGMSDLVRNPLLVTILCVLANNKVPLPHTEIQLYEERMRLLFGDYDIHKKIARVESHRMNLEIAARKVAFKFHRLHKRESNLIDIVSLLSNDQHLKMDENDIELAVKDLFSPCNILIPMNEDGAVGFGHLRYQEFLAARELTQNRSIEIGRLLFDPWWKGVLRFYAQMADDIEHVFDYLIHTPGLENFINAEENVIEMLSVRPESEREGLMMIFDRNIASDLIDSYQD